jgi:small GTP-binding protein
MDKEIKDQEDLIIFNIMTLGESGVGKTSIIKRFVYNKYNDDILSTIGISFAFKEITLKNNKKIKLKLVDTAGQERYRSLAKAYFKNAEAVLYIFSLDKKESLEKIKEWKNLFKLYNGQEGIPSYLIRAKCDLEEEEDSQEKINELMKQYNFLDYKTTSAKDNTNIDELFQEIGEKCYQNINGKERKQKSHVLISDKDRKAKEEKNQRKCELCKTDVY